MSELPYNLNLSKPGQELYDLIDEGITENNINRVGTLIARVPQEDLLNNHEGRQRLCDKIGSALQTAIRECSAPEDAALKGRLAGMYADMIRKISESPSQSPEREL